MGTRLSRTPIHMPFPKPSQSRTLPVCPRYCVVANSNTLGVPSGATARQQARKIKGTKFEKKFELRSG